MKMKILVSFVLASISLTITGCGSSSSNPLAELKSIVGTVECRPSSTENFKVAKQGLILNDMSAIRTKEDSSATIVFKKGGTLRLAANSFFEVKKGTTLGRQETGTGIYKIDKQKNKLSIETPQGLTTILGTEFRQDVTKDNTTVILKEGSIQFTDTKGKEVILKPGERIIVENGKALSSPEKVNSFDVDSFFSPENTLKSF